MEFRSKVKIDNVNNIEPTDKILLVGSCFADNIGKLLQEDDFDCTVNPYGVMYNPASICHTVEKLLRDGGLDYDVAVFTLGTNHVYILNETGEIVDNCEKKPHQLFTEKALSIEECASYLNDAIKLLQKTRPDIRIFLTVSPVRYAKYGYHGSQLSKAALLLATEKIEGATYFPAYEIMNDELRDYRFYQPDMLHPSAQAVEYIYERFQEAYFSARARDFVKEWLPIKKFFAHRPFDANNEDYLREKEKMEERRRKVRKR